MPESLFRREIPRPTHLPIYQCHKRVRGVKIDALVVPLTGDVVTIVPADKRIANFEVSTAYYHKHHPQVGGYYVLYDNNYESFSPADVFESGYTLLIP